MGLNQFFRNTHKWLGIVFSVVFLNMAVTGIFLLEKKNFPWIQPPTQTGAEGRIADFITTQKLFDIIFSKAGPDFKTLEDIDRIDFRPGNRVFKVRSVHNYAEVQIDAVSGEILSSAWRPSDLLEDLHDGSFYAAAVHAVLLPAAGAGLVLLSLSGLYLWLSTSLRKRRQKRR